MICEPTAIRSGVQNARPVFILGIAERCGTNFLQDLLRLHPDCNVDGLELEEDHFVAFSDMLLRYVQRLSRDWKMWWGAEQLQKERELVLRCIGNGLISYLKLQVVNRRVLSGMDVDKELKVLVTKTPKVNNVDMFFRLFPEAELIILIRDGRAVVESAMRTFFRRFDKASREWADRAEMVRRFVGDDSNRDRKYILVKYEDLYGNSEREMRRILSFLRLDETQYNFAAAANLPVRGSSSLHREAAAQKSSTRLATGVHWDPVPRSAGFNPLARWNHWNRARHERFNWIAGDGLVALGYEQKSYPGYHWFWGAWNFLLDKFPIEGTAWLLQRATYELKTNPEKSKALRKLTLKAWTKLKSSFPGARRASKSGV